MVRLYNHEEDYPTVCLWAAEYDIIPPAPEELPHVGVVSETVIAFLYQTDSSKCLIENFIAKPLTPGEAHVDENILEVIEALAAIAKSLGFTEIMGITRFPLLVRLAKQSGYTAEARHTLVKRRLQA